MNFINECLLYSSSVPSCPEVHLYNSTNYRLICHVNDDEKHRILYYSNEITCTLMVTNMNAKKKIFGLFIIFRPVMRASMASSYCTLILLFATLTLSNSFSENSANRQLLRMKKLVEITHDQLLAEGCPDLRLDEAKRSLLSTSKTRVHLEMQTKLYVWQPTLTPILILISKPVCKSTKPVCTSTKPVLILICKF